MHKQSVNTGSNRRRRLFRSHELQIILASLAAIIATYAVATFVVQRGTQVVAELSIVAVYLGFCIVMYLRSSSRQQLAAVSDDDSEIKIESHLAALDEANEFFTGVLKPADAFRLIANRVHPLLPFNTMSLLLLDPTRTGLVVAE